MVGTALRLFRMVTCRGVKLAQCSVRSDWRHGVYALTVVIINDNHRRLNCDDASISCAAMQ